MAITTHHLNPKPLSLAITTIDFDIKVGTIIHAVSTKKPGTYLLKINFGSKLGIKNTLLKTSPKIPPYSLIDLHVCGIIDFQHYQKGIKTTNTILLCMPNHHGHYIPIQPDYCIPNGGSIFS